MNLAGFCFKPKVRQSSAYNITVKLDPNIIFDYSYRHPESKSIDRFRQFLRKISITLIAGILLKRSDHLDHKLATYHPLIRLTKDLVIPS